MKKRHRQSFLNDLAQRVAQVLADHDVPAERIPGVAEDVIFQLAVYFDEAVTGSGANVTLEIAEGGKRLAHGLHEYVYADLELSTANAVGGAPDDGVLPPEPVHDFEIARQRGFPVAITLAREDLASDAALRTALDQGLLMAADILSPRERAAAWKEQEREDGPVVAVLHTARLNGDGAIAGLGSLYPFRSNAYGDYGSTYEDLLRFIRERAGVEPR